jgi:ribonucleotide monophosphatase NagD (HAD superfamily)
MVGDNPASDIEGGRTAGLMTVLVASSDPVRTEPAPDFVVADVAGLVKQGV